MKKRVVTLSVFLGCIATPAVCADYLTEVTSDVYQTTGTPREIATRANACIAQHLASGTTNAQLVVSSDLDGGVIVARSAISYPDGLMQWQIRSTFTFEAREGRFRIAQTNLERFNRVWGPIGKRTGSGWKAQDAFTASASSVTQCVISGPSRTDW